MLSLIDVPHARLCVGTLGHMQCSYHEICIVFIVFMAVLKLATLINSLMQPFMRPLMAGSYIQVICFLITLITHTIGNHYHLIVMQN